MPKQEAIKARNNQKIIPYHIHYQLEMKWVRAHQEVKNTVFKKIELKFTR
jgi:hypothetical protein